MAKFTVNTNRFDPYKTYRFLVKWDGKDVAGASQVTGLSSTPEVAEYRQGGDPSTGHKSPGRQKFEPITLERGVTQDTAFHNWANQVSTAPSAGSEPPLESLRKDLVLEQYDEAGHLEQSYTIYGCWVSEYSALPDLNAGANAIVIQHIKLENEGWEPDPSVTEPVEP